MGITFNILKLRYSDLNYRVFMLILAFVVTIDFFFKCFSPWNHVENKKHSYKPLLTTILAFIIAHVFTSVDIFISLYDFKLLPSILFSTCRTLLSISFFFLCIYF